MTHNDFTYKELLKESYELTKKHFPFLLGLLVISIVAGGITAKIPLAGQLVSIVLSIAGTYLLLMIVKGHTPKYKDALHPFRNYMIAWHYLLALILLGILFVALIGSILLIGTAISIATKSPIALGVAGVICLLAAIYYGTRVSFFRFFIIEDEKLGPIEALKASLRMTKNRFWKILGLVVVLFLLNLVGVIAFVIGLAFTIPMTGIAIVLLYKKWSGHASLQEGPHIASE